ncbi:NAD(P)-binding protein [Zopfia rhizophila CBS 207.26]|uniref:NAD(P)-binding protein n=1 Tax=Zopfia rhizophila CBS 207.26 TaxID=1314779 RepID=A0A6A6ES08_9PEZI|nr:NAD(P)-binding protein [Zopfia rhizophila CBS 207.26]
MSKLLVVIGITGTQGGSVADAFLTAENWRVRGITRDPSKPAAQEWASRGVEIVPADMDNIESLVTAFAGAQAIFAMTDYWYPIRDQAVRAKATERGISADQLCAELEIQRGKNMALAAASPQVQKTLERYVWSSLGDVSRLSGGKFTHVWHFDSKAAVERYIREDPDMAEAGLTDKASFIHVGLYTDNWRRSGAEIQKDPVTGGYWHVSFDDGRTKLPFVWARRDTGPPVKKLVEDVQPGARLLAVSQFAHYREFMAVWAKTLGQKLAGEDGIKRISEQEFRDMLPPIEDIRDHLMSTWLFFVNFGYDGSDPKTIYPKDIGAEHLMTSLEDYIKQEDWSSLLQ